MNTSKTLLAILVEELPKRGGWPLGCHAITQDSDAAINTYNSVDGLEVNKYGTWRCLGSWIDYCITAKNAQCLASDYATAIITSDQYEAALADSQAPAAETDGWITWAGGNLPVEHSALVDLKFRDFPDECGNNAGSYYWPHTNSAADIVAYRLHKAQQVEQPAAEQKPASNADGWIDWAGGECPVKTGTLVDVRYRDGEVRPNLPANLPHPGIRDAQPSFWNNDGMNNDIIAYRLHQPQDANSRANDDRLESDLNECIGQPQENITEIRGDMLEVLNRTGLKVNLNNAVKVVNAFIDAGYRKQ